MGKRTQETRNAISILNNVQASIEDNPALQQPVQDPRLKLLEAYNFLFNTEQGKLVLNDMKAKCNYGYTAFTTDNARLTDFTLGKQSSIIDILQMVNKQKG